MLWCRSWWEAKKVVDKANDMILLIYAMGKKICCQQHINMTVLLLTIIVIVLLIGKQHPEEQV